MARQVESSGTIAWIDRKAFFTAGDGALKVPMSMHRDNRGRLVKRLQESGDIPDGAVIVLQGGEQVNVYDQDTEWDYKQESNFQYLFGVKEPGCWGAIRISDGYAVLFVPALPESFAAWMGPIQPPAWFQRAYEVDEVHVMDNELTVASCVRQDLKASDVIFPVGTNRDSGLPAKRPAFVGLDDVSMPEAACAALYVALAEARVIKSADELKVLQFVNDVSSLAHVEVMQSTRPGVREYIAAAEFQHKAFIRGCWRTGYSCICASGARNTYLHYGHPGNPNAETVERGTLTLRDMGGEYHGYTSDITCTYPVDGTFTEDE